MNTCLHACMPVCILYTYVIIHSYLAQCINLVNKWLKKYITFILFDICTIGYSNQQDILKTRSKNWADVITQDVTSHMHNNYDAPSKWICHFNVIIEKYKLKKRCKFSQNYRHKLAILYLKSDVRSKLLA